MKRYQMVEIEMSPNTAERMMLWCREHRIPVVTKWMDHWDTWEYWGTGSPRDYYNIWDDLDSWDIITFTLLIRNDDLTLWKLKFQ